MYFTENNNDQCHEPGRFLIERIHLISAAALMEILKQNLQMTIAGDE